MEGDRHEGFALRHRKAILSLTLALCLAGVYSAFNMPASVFPQTDFPRVVILIDNGVMPADEMMATITRPVEEAMKDIPGAVNIRSATGRGADVARAMALPVFGGMLIEPLTSFIVPTLYCGYMEFKMRAGFRDERWEENEADGRQEGVRQGVTSNAA